MRDETIARNYADALFEIAVEHEGLEVYSQGIAGVARLLDEHDKFRLFLETPRIDASAKKEVLLRVFGEEVPRRLLNFLLLTIDKRRQRLLRSVSREFQTLMEAHLGRAHIDVTLARPAEDETVQMIATEMTRVLGKDAIPHVRVKPEILGGVVIRTGDTIYDGSLRRRLETMRRRLFAAELPKALHVNGGETARAGPSATAD